MSETQSKYGGNRVHFPPPLVFLALVGAGVASSGGRGLLLFRLRSGPVSPPAPYSPLPDRRL
jgi:hypothetical protein